MKANESIKVILLLVSSVLVNCSVWAVGGERRYVANEIIVKYRKSAADKIETGLHQGKKMGQLQLSASLDELNAKHKIGKAKSVFPKFKENHRRLEAIKNKDKSLLSKREKRILRRMLRAPAGAKVPDLSGIYRIMVELSQGQSLEEVVAAYNADPDVEYAELNHIISFSRVPNDSAYQWQWSKPKIHAPEAWDIHTGSSDVVVAVMDTGVDYTHGDLINNMWINEAERDGVSGVDDDGNGYIDDVYGYDFGFNDSDPMDDDYSMYRGHGTFCSGIIGAEGNNAQYIAGICWNVKIMATKFSNITGEGAEADGATAAYYAVANGADVASLSWGEPYHLATMKAAMDYAHSQGMIVVAGAGNDDTSSRFYPAAYSTVISVGATDYLDHRAGFSNYGSWVDLMAPGVDVVSITSGGGLRVWSGTSFSCPHVAGGCALLLSAFPRLTPDEVYNIIMQSVDPVVPGTCKSNGRLNVFKALQSGNLQEGHIELDGNYYSCSSEIVIYVRDSDLKGLGSCTVVVSADSGDSETVVLNEIESNFGKYEGSISTGSADANIEDGILQLDHDAVITASYEDANDGWGNSVTISDTATADCMYPAVLNVDIDAIGPITTVRFETDEPATVSVRCGTTCGGPYTIEVNVPSVAMTHSVELIGISANTEYFIAIEATDGVGNVTVDGNSGQCYPFTSDGPGDIYVPGDYLTIQEAIDSSWDSGTVWVADGVYSGEGNRDLKFRGRAITVRSENGPNNCIIDSNGWNHRGFVFISGESISSVLDGFTVTGGNIQNGGGIYCGSSSPTIRNCIIERNSSNYGGGLFCIDGSPVLINCIFRMNTASYAGGGMFGVLGNPTLTDCSFIGNSTKDGGGIYDENGSLTLTGCRFSMNSADNGGGLTASDCTLMVTDCTFNENSAVAAGGAIQNILSNSTLTNCAFSENSGGNQGGGMANEESSLWVTDCNFIGNSAKQGGGMRNYLGSAGLVNCLFGGKIASDEGAGLFNNDSNLAASDCSIIGNISGSACGGVYSFYGESILSTCVIAENTGAGVYSLDNDLTITNCEILRNMDCGVYSYIESHWGTVILANCIIAGNGSTGISLGWGRSDISNCLIVGNGADGIFLVDNMPSKITGNTISGNAGDGIDFSRRCRVGIENCIIYDNFGEQIFNRGDRVTINYSDIGAGWPGVGNIDVDPCFKAAGYWADVNDVNIPVDPNDPNALWIDGDYHLAANSQCIDNGDAAYAIDPNETDLDGNMRIVDGDNDGNSVVDMGAYEFFIPPIEVAMKFTPHSLNPESNGNWVKAHFSFPFGFDAGDIDVNSPVVLEPSGIEAEYVKVFVNDDGLVEVEAGFARGAFCSNGAIDGGVTVTGRLVDGRDFYGVDLVRIIDRRLEGVALLAMHWLEQCGPPKWCQGSDTNADGIVDLIDLVLVKGCCVEVISK